MRSFAIDEPGSPVRALYATLAGTPTKLYLHVINATKRVNGKISRLTLKPITLLITYPTPVISVERSPGPEMD